MPHRGSEATLAGWSTTAANAATKKEQAALKALDEATKKTQTAAEKLKQAKEARKALPKTAKGTPAAAEALQEEQAARKALEEAAKERAAALRALKKAQQDSKELARVANKAQGAVQKARNAEQAASKAAAEANAAKTAADKGKAVVQTEQAASEMESGVQVMQGTEQLGEQIPKYVEYRANWESRSLKEAIEKFSPGATAVPDIKPHKLAYINKETGVKVVYDTKGRYFRIKDRDNYHLNWEGEKVHFLEGMYGEEASNYFHKNTHFNDID